MKALTVSWKCGVKVAPHFSPSTKMKPEAWMVIFTRNEFIPGHLIPESKSKEEDELNKFVTTLLREEGMNPFNTKVQTSRRKQFIRIQWVMWSPPYESIVYNRANAIRTLSTKIKEKCEELYSR